MPEPVAGLRDAGHLIASAAAAGNEMLALICSRAPATEVALAATVMRDYLAELGCLRLDAGILRDHGDERYADGVEDGIAVGRAAVLAEQAAAAGNARDRLRVIRPQRGTGSFPALPQAAGAG